MAKSEKEKKNRHFFKDFKAELKKVIWLTPKQLANNTIAVITIVLITGVIVFVLDLTFETLNSQGINRLRNVVESSSSTEENTEDTNEADDSTNTDNTSSDTNDTNTDNEE